MTPPLISILDSPRMDSRSPAIPRRIPIPRTGSLLAIKSAIILRLRPATSTLVNLICLRTHYPQARLAQTLKPVVGRLTRLAFFRSETTSRFSASSVLHDPRSERIYPRLVPSCSFLEQH